MRSGEKTEKEDLSVTHSSLGAGRNHTPGPWEARPPRIGASITIYAGGVPIATTCSNTSPATMEMHRRGEVTANARLIAAAPELLGALRGLLVDEGLHNIGCKERAPGYDDSRCCPVHIARTVLAKIQS